MKNTLLLLVLLVTAITSAQIVNIPDPAFKAELIADGVDTNMDGEIQIIEAEATTAMSLNTQAIADLEGIQSFINLESFVSLGTEISALNLSNNINLTMVRVDQGALLTSIDISSCPLLEELRLYDTAITTLDCNANPNLTLLNFIGNDALETVFIKNGADESLGIDPGSWSENWDFGNNPNLLYVCADEFQVVELQQFAGTDYPVNTFCTFSPGGDVNTITGVTQFDDELDGCDAGDSIIPFTSFSVDLDGVATGVIAYSNSAGVYNVYAGQAGTYRLTPNLENPLYFDISPDPADVVIPVIDNSITVQDFCVEAVGIQPDLEVVIAPIIPARPGFEATYSLFFKNKGNQTLSGDVQFNYSEALQDFVSSSVTPDAQAAGILTYNFTDLQPYQSETIEIVLAVNSPMDTPPVNIGDILVLFADVNPIAGDVTPFDNSFTLDQTVIGSYDPNNIVCIQGEEVPTTFIGEFLHYVINFENTGTAPAENVVVTMEIDPTDFDKSTLQILSASHNMQTVLNDDVAEFHFQNISLDTGGHGNILLKMKTNDDLITADEVGAQANIYFDFNFPVETNEAVTSFRVLGVDEFNTSQVTVYPNPASDIVILQSFQMITNISMFDVMGREVTTLSINSLSAQIDVSALNGGIYFFSIETERGVITKKVIKQ